MQTDKGTWLKWIVVSCSIILAVALAVILIIPAFISGNFIRQKVIQILDERFPSVHQVGAFSFHWPNQINISYITIQKREESREEPIKFEDIQGNLKLLPLLFKNIVVKKISIREINYENRLLIKDIVTDKFSFTNRVVSSRVRLSVNEGPAAVKGVIDFRQKKPTFDLSIEAKDIHITQDIPFLSILPIFTTRDGEVGGILSLKGYLRGNGLGREILNKKLVADMKLEVKNGYIKGNKLLSSILEIIGVKDAYSFDLMEAVIQIKDGKISTPKMDIQSPLLSLNASGVTKLDGSISYDAAVKFNKEHLGKDVEKIAGLLLKEDALPIEIRGTPKTRRSR
ncbi:MAG: AsmA-like C-terminal region-containing protein [Candidatus Brocadiales bacterium]|nr:AsmA-like C-terminal region-containing protein [Candidatus Brocadiales bacterium]